MSLRQGLDFNLEAASAFLCVVFCEQYCLMSTELSIIVCVVVSNLLEGLCLEGRGMMGVCSNAVSPQRWRIRQEFMYTASK